MNRQDYFKAALPTAYIYADWLLSLFSLSKPDKGGYKLDPYPYRLVAKEDGYYYVDNTPDRALVKLDDADDVKQPLFTPHDPIHLRSGDMENVTVPIDTWIGDAITNQLIFVYPFGAKFPFYTHSLKEGKWKGNIIDKMVADKFRAYPADGSRDPSAIYVDELLKYFEGVSSLTNLSTICVPSGSKRAYTVSPEIIAKRDELLLKYAKELKDPSTLAPTVATIEKILTDMVREYLKGDVSAGFFIDDKSINVAYKKLYIMHGLENGFDGYSTPTLVPTALTEGWDMEHIAAYNDSTRSGSYSRGKLTELGGEAVKYYQRVFQNTRIIEDDCGATGGLEWAVTDDIKKRLVHLWQIAGGKIELLTPEKLDSLVGKSIFIRSPMLCKSAAPSFCAKCMGEIIASNPNGLTIGASSIGSLFMGIFMSAMHGKTLKTVPYIPAMSLT